MMTARVPLLNLHAQYEPLRGELLTAIARVCDSQRFILGPEVDAFEAEVAAAIGVGHAIGVSSGTDALLAAMMAIGVGPGDEVVTSTYSFFATAGCIVRLGARPVLVDIDPVTYNLDPGAVAAAVTPKTKAIIPVHLFGQSADLDPILAVAQRVGARVIEDACQAIGARYKDRPVGAIGDLGCFSFFPSKNLGAFGDAGLVTTNDADLARRVRVMRAHGAQVKYHHDQVGGNFRLDALQAAVLRVKLPHLPGWTSGRQLNAERYRALFRGADPGQRVRLPAEAPYATHIYNQFAIRVPRRDELRAFLESNGIGTEVYYPVPFHLQRCFADLGYAPGAFPEAEAAAAESLALPIYAELTNDQLRRVVDGVTGFLERAS